MKPKKILIVEDEKALLDALKLYFDKEDYEVETATDGLEGLEKLKTFSPDLIVLDIVMPRLDGIGFLHKLREDEKFKDLPVAVVTNWTNEEKRNEAKALGARSYLVKANYDINEIISKIKEML